MKRGLNIYRIYNGNGHILNSGRSEVNKDEFNSGLKWKGPQTQQLRPSQDFLQVSYVRNLVPISDAFGEKGS